VERKERSLYLIITKRLSISPSPLVYSLYPAFLDLRHSSEGAYAVNPEPSVHDIEKHASYVRYGIQWLGVSHTASIHRGVAEVACRLISTEPLRYGHHRHSHPRSKKKNLYRELQVYHRLWPADTAMAMDQDQSAALELHQKGQPTSLTHVISRRAPTDHQQLAPSYPSTR
jgi:hypothetical protein